MERAVARIDFEAIRANCTRLKAELRDGAELCAVVKADGYGHGADGCADAALAGGRDAAGGGDRGRGRTGRPPPPAHPPADDGGADRRAEVDIVLSAGSEVAVWREGFRRLLADRARAQGRPARVHVKYDSGMGRLGNPDPERGAGAGPRLRRRSEPRAGRRLDPLRDRRRTRLAPSSTSSSAASRRSRRRSRPSSPTAIAHAANSAAVFREPRSHFDMARCGVADLRARPLPGRPGRARPGAGALAALLRRRRQALRPPAPAPATGSAGRRRRRPGSGSCRSATATASAAGSATTPRSWSAAAASRWSGRSRWTT